jgi:small GTP-binding protein
MLQYWHGGGKDATPSAWSGPTCFDVLIARLRRNAGRGAVHTQCGVRMISKKICMVGAFAVGKTALVEQYVRSIFSNRYLSTVGVKISKKECRVGEQDVNLVLWDMEGKDEYNEINTFYLRGAMGFFLVADGTRKDTLNTALQIRLLVIDTTGDIPHYLVLNKADLRADWQVTADDIAYLEQQGIQVLTTSAKTGAGVEDAFIRLTEAMLRSG